MKIVQRFGKCNDINMRTNCNINLKTAIQSQIELVVIHGN